VLPLILLALAAAPAATAKPSAWKPQPPETTSAWLGFSGATILVRSVDDPRRPGTARRRLTLRTASGATVSLPLQDGGGYAKNWALSLYAVGNHDFLLLSERDCVAIDPSGPKLQRCSKPAACATKRTFVGGFSWMNAYDPPHGRFGHRWRFLPAHDMGRGGGC
jgi:hypothetical protein